MNFWITTDTHFGHESIVKAGHRPPKFEDKILNNTRNCVRHEDVLIHLGDVSFTDHKYWLNTLRRFCLGKMWLTVGNHDKPPSWYIENGFDFASEFIILTYLGKRVLLSHEPKEDLLGCDLNIHGHLHTGVHRADEGYPQTDRHICVALESNHYQAVTLKTLIRGKF